MGRERKAGERETGMTMRRGVVSKTTTRGRRGGGRRRRRSRQWRQGTRDSEAKLKEIVCLFGC
jgi:hypothetical protein